jgi:ribonuclease HI
MEMMAVITALEALKKPCSVKLVTDSNYVVQGMTSWIFQWMRNNWKNSQKKQVLNRDLWEKLLSLSHLHDIRREWIKGHNEHAENERCDKLARHAIRKCSKTPLPD